jgi:hypothetical protein
MSSIWQPIRTAPKDGTSILIFEAHLGPAGIVRLSRWRDDTIPSGWTGAENSPSHWLPLPLAPNAAGRSRAHDGRETSTDTDTATILSLVEARRIASNPAQARTPLQTKKE